MKEVKKALLDVMNQAEKLWELLGDSATFESMSVSDLERLLGEVEELEAKVKPLRSRDPEFDQIYFDCKLMKCFIVGEQNYQVTGSFFEPGK